MKVIKGDKAQEIWEALFPEQSAEDIREVELWRDKGYIELSGLFGDDRHSDNSWTDSVEIKGSKGKSLEEIIGSLL